MSGRVRPTVAGSGRLRVEPGTVGPVTPFLERLFSILDLVLFLHSMRKPVECEHGLIHCPR